MVERIWNTEGVPPAEHLAMWEHVAATAWVAVSVARRETGPGLPSQVAARTYGAVEISRIATRPQSVQRSSGLVAADPGSRFFLNLPLTESTFARQDGRQARLRPGDFTVVDSRRPFELGFNAPLRQISVTIPHELLLPRLQAVNSVMGTRIPGDEGLGAAVSQIVRTLATMPGALDRRGARALGDQVVQLLALALGAAVPNSRHPPRPLIRQAALDEIERSLSNPSLSPGMVAERLGISVRLLHRLFAEQGPSFGRWLMERRLIGAHLALTNPAQEDWTIAEIAVEYGFRDPSHFARVYRAAYGTSPSSARASARGGAAP